MNLPKSATLVSLRKTPVPAVTIYGDDADKSLTRIVWDLIPGHNVRVLTPQTREELFEEAYHSAIVFVMVGEASPENLKIAEVLGGMKGVVADIIAITSEPDIRKRLHILAAEFDAIYNMEIVPNEDFRKIFAHKLKKGIMRLEARFQEDEYQTFREFMSVSADAFIVFDPQKRIFYSSEHFLRRFPNMVDLFVRGVPAIRIFEGMALNLGLAPEDPAYQEARAFWQALRGQCEFRMKDSTYLRMTAVPLQSGAGTILSITDITDYKNQEIALARALVSEQEASSLQKQFISMVSHEFRNPLAIVDGNAQILERRFTSLPTFEVTNRLRTIRSAVSRTVNMMEAVLSSNMLKTGKLSLNVEEFNLKELLVELCEEQKNLSRDLSLAWHLDALPDTVRLDRKMMTIVLTNLLSNAVKFSPRDPVVQVYGECDADGIRVSIEDNGVGIPKEEIGQVCERFFRATTSSGIPGSGVGLSLVRDLLHLQGGRLEIDSDMGQGTRMVVHLPPRFSPSPFPLPQRGEGKEEEEGRKSSPHEGED